jgi:hypothetical protein
VTNTAGAAKCASCLLERPGSRVVPFVKVSGVSFHSTRDVGALG